MKFLRDLHRVSEFLFFLCGILFLGAYLFYKNDIFAYPSEVFLRYGDLAFFFVCVLFAGTSLRLSFSHQIKSQRQERGEQEGEEHPILDVILILLGIILFCGGVYIDFGIPDVV